MTPAAIDQRRQAARTHGIHALRRRGPDALEPEKIGSLAELRQLLRTHPGRLELMEEQAARLGLICEMAFAELAEARARGESIWEGAIIKRAGTYFAEYRRLLTSLPDADRDGLAADIITEKINHEQDT
jgi:hypothetical protein